MKNKICTCCEEEIGFIGFHIFDPTETEGNQYSHMGCFIWQDHVPDASERINDLLIYIREAIEMIWEDGATTEEMEALIQSAIPNVEDLRKVIGEVKQNIQRRREFLAAGRPQFLDVEASHV
jgi:hypothetical protein